MKKLILPLALLLLISLAEASYSQAIDNDSEDEVLNGYLRIAVAGMDSAYVVINDDFKGALHFASGDTLALPVGSADLRIIQRYYVDQTASFTIEENEVTGWRASLVPIAGRSRLIGMSSYPRIFWGANNFILSDPETELYINAEYIGTHFATVDTTGRFEVLGVHSSGATFRKTFRADDDESLFHSHRRMLQPSRTISMALSWVPGGSQFYKGQNIKAASFITGLLGGTALAFNYDSLYRERYDEFNELADLYASAGDVSEAYELGIRAQSARDDAERYANIRDVFIYGTAVLYLVNIVDGFIAPSIGFRDSSRIINPYMDFNPVYRQPVIGFQASF
ncbi:MAG: DUF5683 domain-containing protein [Balneolia bacterium]|nr:DUF5683 domain-containing protein [Balneolia bacterium]